MTRQLIVQLVFMIAAIAALYYFDRFISATILCLLALVVVTLALVAPDRLYRIQQMGKRAGLWVGNGIGVFLLTVVYFVLFVPGGLLLRIARIDLLNRRFPTRGKTNWRDRINYGEDKLLYKKLYTRPHAANGSKKAIR